MMVRVSVSDDDMCNRRPFILWDQAPEIEQIEVLTGVYRDPCSALLDKECVIQVVGDPHSNYSQAYVRNRGNDPLAVADRAVGR